MSREDYEAIARAIRQSYEFRKEGEATAMQIAMNLCYVLKADNERFDRKRFMQACGFED